MRRGAAALALAAAFALVGCESNETRSARLARVGSHALAAQKGLQIGARNASVQVVSTAVVHDQNGTAAVVELRNTGARTLVDVPIAIDVQDAQGHSLYTNSTPGLEASLVHVPAIGPHAEFTWVNDQVQAAGAPARVLATVGTSPTRPTPVPDLRITGLRLYHDPTSGLSATGTLTDQLAALQTKVVVFAVARRGTQIVAAGRAIVPKVPPGHPTSFEVFFIGNPQGATLHAIAPAVTG